MLAVRFSCEAALTRAALAALSDVLTKQRVARLRLVLRCQRCLGLGQAHRHRLRLRGRVRQSDAEALERIGLAAETGLNRAECFGDVDIEDRRHVRGALGERDRLVGRDVGAVAHVDEGRADRRDELVQLPHGEAGLLVGHLRKVADRLGAVAEHDVHCVLRLAQRGRGVGRLLPGHGESAQHAHGREERLAERLLHLAGEGLHVLLGRAAICRQLDDEVSDG
jgi:hypothetical protein